MADIHNLDLSSTGPGQINLFFTETNLTSGLAAQFFMNFTGTGSGLTLTRSFYLDTTNSGLTTTLLGSCSLYDCGFMSSLVQSLSGQFSVTEEISLTATGSGFLSSDDDISVPEPAALSLLGAGLLALGALSRRRKTATV